MRVLAISYMVPPMLYPQSIQIGRLLYYLDAEVSLISGDDSGDSKSCDMYPDFHRRLSAHLSLPFRRRVPSLTHRILFRLSSRYARQPDEYRRWAREAVKPALRWMLAMQPSPEVIVSFGQPMSDHLLGLELSRRSGIPLVAHFSDPWVDDPFIVRDAISRRSNLELEGNVVERAQRLVFPSGPLRDLVMTKYPRSWLEKTAVVPHSFDRSLYDSHDRARNGSLVLRYLGSLTGTRSPEPLFVALQMIAADDADLLRDVRVELVGHISQRMRLSRALALLPEGLVHFRRTVGYLESLRLMRQSDLLLLIDAPIDYSVFFPSKLVDYFGAGRPVLGITSPGVARDLIESFGGTTASPASPQQVAEKLAAVIRELRSDRSRPFLAPPQFAAECVVPSFLQVLQSAIS